MTSKWKDVNVQSVVKRRSEKLATRVELKFFNQ